MTSTCGAALEAFISEHEYCGEPDVGFEDNRVWMTCSCGATITGTLTMTDRLRRRAR
jgi:hypothetical protein